jgi:hypothetical protein
MYEQQGALTAHLLASIVPLSIDIPQLLHVVMAPRMYTAYRTSPGRTSSEPPERWRARTPRSHLSPPLQLSQPLQLAPQRTAQKKKGKKNHRLSKNDYTPASGRSFKEAFWIGAKAAFSSAPGRADALTTRSSVTYCNKNCPLASHRGAESISLFLAPHVDLCVRSRRKNAGPYTT